MKKLLITLSMLTIIACNNFPVEKEIIMQNDSIDIYKDSIVLYKSIALQQAELLSDCMFEKAELEEALDSKQAVIDSLQEELIVCEFKLYRIAEYNKIAANGNNIKFLRGWINRTLND